MFSSRACAHTSSAANRYSAERQQQGAADRAEVHSDPGPHVHARQQVGERVVAAGAGGGDRLFLGDAGGQVAADDSVEQQVGGVPEDPRADHAESRPRLTPSADDRRGQPALRGQPLDQPDGRAAEVAGPLGRCQHHRRRKVSARLRRGHAERPCGDSRA